MKIYEYENYEDYVEAQTKANVEKLKNYWINQSTIESIYKKKPIASVILCHGTRNALEQKYFKELYPYADITGTEISHTASQFEMTVQHDFHEELASHTGRCDIVYSNSFDHSYDPEKSMKAWLGQLAPGGSLFLEAMLGIDNKSKRSDPLSIEIKEIKELVEKLGGKVTDEYNVTGGRGRVTRMLVIEK